MEIRVYYEDTDCGNVVYYANYLGWFERGRTEFFREIGIPYTDVEKHGIITPVSEVYCKYHKPARYDDLVEIEASVASFKKVTIVFDYQIYRKSDRALLVSGYTRHGFIDLEGRIVKIPAFIHEKIASLIEEGASEKDER